MGSVPHTKINVAAMVVVAAAGQTGQFANCSLQKLKIIPNSTFSINFFLIPPGLYLL